jgi:hypothetical protein
MPLELCITLRWVLRVNAVQALRCLEVDSVDVIALPEGECSCDCVTLRLTVLMLYSYCSCDVRRFELIIL